MIITELIKEECNMKCKVRLTHTVEMFVEGPSEEAIQEWLLCTTPEEARDMAIRGISEDYNEEIIAYVRDDSEVDYIIGDE
jgi:hypothetical protein